MSVDLSQAVHIAIENSPELARLRSRVAQGKARVDEVLAAVRTNLALTPSYTYLQPEVAASLGGAKTPLVVASNYNVALTLNQTISTFGRIGWLAQAARLSVHQAEEEYQAGIHDLVDLVTTAYVRALLARQNEAIAREQLRVAQAHLDESQVLYKGGTVARFDVLRNRTTVSQAEQEVINARNGRSVADTTLLSLMGQPTARPLELDLLAPPGPPPPTRDEGLRRAFANRPELKALAFAVSSAESSVRGHQAQLNPTLSLTSSYNVRNAVGIAGTPTLWNTGLVLGIPILDGGLTRAQVKEAQETVVQLQQTHETARRAVELEVQNAWATLLNTWERIRVSNQQVEEATEALRVAEVRYRSGVGTNVERLDATNSLTLAQFSQAQAVTEYLTAEAHWKRAIAADLQDTGVERPQDASRKPPAPRP